MKKKAVEKWCYLTKESCAFAYLAVDLLVLETKSDFIAFYFFEPCSTDTDEPRNELQNLFFFLEHQK